jgi:aminocarboxymuconate-semialdehyde decarboxylase
VVVDPHCHVSLTHDRELPAGLVAHAGASLVVLGSDRPFDMGTDRPVTGIRVPGMPQAEELIPGGNARALLPAGLPGAADG